MVKKHYSDYVRHALRFYARNLDASAFKCSAAEQNWSACNTVLDEHFPEYRELLISVYQAFDTMGDNVYEAAKKYNVPQDNIWSMMADLERRVAKERGLI
jgi:hypothetical protein